MKFLKQAGYGKFVVANIQVCQSKSACRPPQIYSYRGIFENKKGPEAGFQATVFFRNFW